MTANQAPAGNLICPSYLAHPHSLSLAEITWHICKFLHGVGVLNS